MQSFIKEVGRGKKGSKDLPLEQAKQAADLLMSGEASPAQTGAFLMAERMKSETVEELLAFVHAGRERSLSVKHTTQGVLDCAGAYDGRGKSFAATIPVAAVLASVGVPVVLHGSATLPPKYGVTLMDIVQALQAPVDTTSEAAGNRLEQHRLAFLETESFCEPLQRLRPIRQELGVRTLLNTAEKFLNLAGADYAIAGVFHTSALEKAAELMVHLGYPKGMIVQGVDGSEDVPTNRPFACCVIRDGAMEKHLIDPKEYDVAAEMDTTRLSAEEQAEQILAVLKGAPEHRNNVLLNSALRLWLTDRADSLQSGIVVARTALDSGSALEAFRAWQNS